MFGKDFLKGEIFLKVTEEDGSFKDHHVKNAVQEAWTNALFQVLCQGQHYEFSHTIGYMDVVANDGTSDGTKSYSVGTGDTNVVVDNNAGLIYSDMVVTGNGTSATANVNTSQTGTQIAIDGASGTILINMVVTGTGIAGTTGTLPYVTAVNSDQTLVTLSSLQTLADNVPLTFKTGITGTTGVSPTVSTVTDQNTLVLSSNQTLMDGTALTFRSNKTTLVSNAIDVLIATVRTDENDIEMERLTMEE